MKRLHSILSLALAILLVVSLLPLQVAEAVDANGYMTLQEAAKYVRGEFAQYKTDVKVKFWFKSTEAYSTRELWELLKEEVMRHTGVGEEGDYMYWSFQTVSYDAVDQFDGTTHYVDFAYITPQYNNTAEQERELEAKLAQVMSSLNLSGKSDYEKIKAVYDYVCQNIVYSETVLSSGASTLMPPDYLKIYYSAYAALMLGETTCQGFASLIYRMMLAAGIDCRLITGDVHGWNIVKLDGKYYYLDPTWDSDYWHRFGKYRYFLRGSADFRTTGLIEDGTYSASEHKTWAWQYNPEFLDQYPISAVDYGQADLCTGDASAVLGSGKCGDQANWVLTADGKLTISGTGALWDAQFKAFWEDQGLCLRWNGLNAYIKQVEIQEGITHLGNAAFVNCPRLTKVTFPASLESMGEYAFALCENLAQVTLPNTVKTLGNYVFFQCPRLESVVISAGMKEIPSNAFTGCTNLKTVTIPNGVQKIGEAAFASCDLLESVQIPASVTALGPMVFAQSFNSNKALSLTVPATVTEVGFQCFAECGLQEIIFNARVTNVEYWMFNYCHNLRKVTLSDTIQTFTENTFYECVNLDSIALPAGLTDLGRWPFVGCRSLKTIVWPSALTTIPELAFSDCVGLESVTLPDSLVTIDAGAFSACTGLKRVTIPASVKNLGDMPFANCSALETVRFEGDAPQVGANPFAFAGNIAVYYPKNNNTWTQNVKDQLMAGHPLVTFKATHGPNDEHTAGDWQSNADSHWKACTDCGAILQTYPHSWNAGSVTQEPNCKYEGTKTFTCTDCGATRNEAIPTVDTHSYDAVCDEACNFCGLTRPVTHTFGTEWVSDSQSHWHGCAVCGGKKDEALHTPGPAATADTPQICTDCNWVIQAALNHVHDDNMQMQHNNSGHWYACSGCSEKLSFAEHTWQDSCDDKCDECGYTRSVNHNWADGICTECGQAESDQTDPEVPGPSQGEEAGPEGWIWIVVAVVAAVAMILLKKKK